MATPQRSRWYTVAFRFWVTVFVLAIVSATPLGVGCSKGATGSSEPSTPEFWVEIDDESGGMHTYRHSVPGGWLVCISGGSGKAGVCFVPDPAHEWVVDR